MGGGSQRMVGSLLHQSRPFKRKIMTIEKIAFKNPAYVEWVKRATYGSVAILAIQRGTLDGCWEDLIGEYLKIDCRQLNPAAFDTMQDCGFDHFDESSWKTAGSIIVNNNKITL